MIDIKTYACGIVIIVLMTVIGLNKYEYHKLKAEYLEYKGSINDQISKAKIEKARIEAEQRAKHDKEIADYAADLDRLKRILDGLQKPRIVSREEALRVDGTSTSSMPEASTDTSRTLKASEIDSCVKRSAFFAAALNDTLQCSRLIELVKSSDN